MKSRWQKISVDMKASLEWITAHQNMGRLGWSNRIFCVVSMSQLYSCWKEGEVGVQWPSLSWLLLWRWLGWHFLWQHLEALFSTLTQSNCENCSPVQYRWKSGFVSLEASKRAHAWLCGGTWIFAVNRHPSQLLSDLAEEKCPASIQRVSEIKSKP